MHCSRWPCWPFPGFFLSLLSSGGQPLHPCPTPNSQLSGDNTGVNPVHCVTQPGRLVVQRGCCCLGLRSNAILPSLCSVCSRLWERVTGQGTGAGGRGRGEMCFSLLTGSLPAPAFVWVHTPPRTCPISEDWPSHLWAMNLRLAWVINQRQSPEKNLLLKLF